MSLKHSNNKIIIIMKSWFACLIVIARCKIGPLGYMVEFYFLVRDVVMTDSTEKWWSKNHAKNDRQKEKRTRGELDKLEVKMQIQQRAVVRVNQWRSMKSAMLLRQSYNFVQTLLHWWATHSSQYYVKQECLALMTTDNSMPTCHMKDRLES